MGGDTLLSGTILTQTLTGASAQTLTLGNSPTDCLSVETEILLDQEPVRASGTACRQADGTWRLWPADPTTTN